MSQATEYGLVVSAAPMFVQTPAPAGERWNWAEATPEPASAEFEETVTALPRTFAGLRPVIAPDGLVLSTRTLVTSAEVKVLPALSVVTTRRS